jgi:hypothetical protein
MPKAYHAELADVSGRAARDAIGTRRRLEAVDKRAQRFEEHGHTESGIWRLGKIARSFASFA